jgi:catechol 2,3-dioxygenase-like lactoylglutathione lyase family enzyme
MTQHLAAIALVVPDYDEAIAFYVGKLGFELVEDTRLSETKRWVLVAPPGLPGDAPAARQGRRSGAEDAHRQPGRRPRLPFPPHR